MVNVAAGYIKGRPVSLAVLDYGLFQVHANGRIIGIVGFVIRTDREETILVDTGFPAKYAQDADRASAEDGLENFGQVLSLTPDNLPEAQLGLLGLTPSDVDLLVLTHSHIDHVGGIAGFPGAPILLSRIEHELTAPLYFGGNRALGWPDRTYVPVDGDCDLGPGLRLLAAPGHVAGQLAIWLELPETGPVLIASDAISRPAEIAERFDTAADPQAAVASAARLMALADHTGAMVIYGHCPAQWPELKKAPDLYC
ncbi:MAG: N-acyl homoserine lactonase family protein [bacterium]